MQSYILRQTDVVLLNHSFSVKVNITSSISIKLTEWNMTILPEVSAIISQNLIYHSIVREGFGLRQ